MFLKVDMQQNQYIILLKNKVYIPMCEKGMNEKSRKRVG